jgi:hypothetical protein
MQNEWKDIKIFINSTFNDMHAERDYLVKNVFPELAEWCEQRKLRLIDIDLRGYHNGRLGSERYGAQVFKRNL